jgi:hypothetical protein
MDHNLVDAMETFQILSRHDIGRNMLGEQVSFDASKESPQSPCKMDGADAFDGVGGRIDFAQLQLEMKEMCSVFHSQCLKWQYSHFWGDLLIIYGCSFRLSIRHFVHTVIPTVQTRFPLLPDR